MTIEIANDLLHHANVSDSEIQLVVAIWLFTEKDLSLGLAAQVARLHKIQFQRELARRHIPVHYSEEDLVRDYQSATQS